MKVVAYLSGVPSPEKSSHKTEALTRFITGVNACGDVGVAHVGRQLVQADVGVIQGWVHAGSPNTSHLMVRRSVANNIKNKHTIIIDSNLFNYDVGKFHPRHYSRYSMDGVFPTTGNYFWDNPDPNRWKQICKDLNISLKDWRSKGDHILLACQRNGGWSMGGYEVTSWVENTVKEIRKYSDRPIVVRGHPGDKKAKVYLSAKNKNWSLSKNEKIKQDFENAWAVVTYNSSPGVAAAIEGVPVFVTDPKPKTSQAYAVSNTNLADIENPKTFDRQHWAEKLAMCHWTFDELSSGAAWNHMRNYV